MGAKLCGYSMLGVTLPSDHPNANDEFFGARCECGAHVTVVYGRIPAHLPGVDERPPDEACEPRPVPADHGTDRADEEGEDRG